MPISACFETVWYTWLIVLLLQLLVQALYGGQDINDMGVELVTTTNL
jgi:hypothetical protein